MNRKLLLLPATTLLLAFAPAPLAPWDYVYTEGTYGSDGPVVSLVTTDVGAVYGPAKIDTSFSPLQASLSPSVAPSYNYVETFGWSNGGSVIKQDRTDPVYDVGGTRMDPVGTVVAKIGSAYPYVTVINYIPTILVFDYAKLLFQVGNGPGATKELEDTSADLTATQALLVQTEAAVVGYRSGATLDAFVKRVDTTGTVNASWSGSITNAQVKAVRAAPMMISGVQKLAVLCNVTPSSGSPYIRIYRLAWPTLAQETYADYTSTLGGLVGTDIASTMNTSSATPPVAFTGYITGPSRPYGPAWYVGYTNQNLAMQSGWPYVSGTTEAGMPRRVRFSTTSETRPIVFGDLAPVTGMSAGTSLSTFKKYTAAGGSQWLYQPVTTGTTSVDMSGYSGAVIGLSTVSTTTVRVSRVTDSGTTYTASSTTVAIPGGGAGKCVGAVSGFTNNTFIGGNGATTTGAVWAHGRSL